MIGSQGVLALDPSTGYADVVGPSTAVLDNTGTIATAGSISSAPAYFEIPLVNQSGGTVTVGAPSTKQDEGTLTSNSGTFIVASGGNLALTGGSTFTDPAGTLALTRERLSEGVRHVFTQSGRDRIGESRLVLRQRGHPGRLGRVGQLRRHRQQHSVRHHSLRSDRHRGRIVGQCPRGPAQRRDRRRDPRPRSLHRLRRRSPALVVSPSPRVACPVDFGRQQFTGRLLRDSADQRVQAAPSPSAPPRPSRTKAPSTSSSGDLHRFFRWQPGPLRWLRNFTGAGGDARPLGDDGARAAAPSPSPAGRRIGESRGHQRWGHSGRLSAGSGSFDVTGSSTLSGTIPSGQTVTVDGSSANVQLALPSAVTDDGTLALKPSTGYADITGSGGLTVASGGVLSTSDANSSQSAFFETPVTNQTGGTVTVGAPSTGRSRTKAPSPPTRGPSPSLPVATLVLSGSSTFTDVAGTLALDGDDAERGRWHLHPSPGGTESGNPVVLNGGATLARLGRVTGGFDVTGSSTPVRHHSLRSDGHRVDGSSANVQTWPCPARRDRRRDPGPQTLHRLRRHHRFRWPHLWPPAVFCPPQGPVRPRPPTSRPR